jgi:hypothetical protein
LGANIQAVGQTKMLSKQKKQQKEGQKLVIIGNFLQAVANAAQSGLTLKLGKTAKNKKANNLIAFGNLLQAVGNSIIAIASSNS